MEKRSQRLHLRSGKDHGGCMGGLVSIFDFRYARFTRDYIIHRKHGDMQPSDSIGDGYPTIMSENELLAYSEEVHQTTKHLQDKGLKKSGAVETSVKEVMENAMSVEHTMKKNMGNSDVNFNQIDLRHGGHIRVKPEEVNNNHSKSWHIEYRDNWSVAEYTCDQVLDQETSNNINMGIILEEFCRLNLKGSYLKQDTKDTVSKRSDQVRSLVEEKLAAAIKVFISHRFSNDKHLTEDPRTHCSKELMDALRTLSLNKELLFELLQDPNSLLVKNIQSIEDEQFAEVQYTNKLRVEPSRKSRPNEFEGQKHRRIFGRRRKLQDNNILKNYGKSSSLSKIVILKPGPTATIDSGPDNIMSTSLQSMGDKSHRGRNHYHFSLNELKRKLKLAIGKDRHGLYHDNKLPRQIGEGNGDWSSSNKDNFYTERFSKSPLGSKRVDTIEIPLKGQTTMEDETIEVTSQEFSGIYSESKKQPFEVLSNGNEKEELVERQLKSPGRIPSLPKHSFTPIGIPKKEREDKVSADSKYHMVNKNTWHLIQENYLIQQTSPKQNLDRPSFIANNEANEKPQSAELNSDGSRNVDSNKLASYTKEVKTCRELLESISVTNSDVQDHIQVCEISHESSSSLFDNESLSCDATKVYHDDEYRTSVEMDLGEGDGSSFSPPRSPLSPSITGKIVTPGSCFDKEEWQSPISVLEPLFSEGDISPSNTKLKPVTAVQPLETPCAECVSSNTNHSACTQICINDEESAYEYVEAVLLGSDLNWDEYLMRWLSSNQVLDPSLFDDLKSFSSRSDHDQKLLFDCTNDILKEACRRYFGHSVVNQNFRIVPRGMKLITEVWQGVEQHINQPPEYASDNILRRDMLKPGTWMDLGDETDNVIIELENSIFEELLEDTILCLDHDGLKNVV